MVLLATIILPHGAMPYDGDPSSESAACRERHARLTTELKDSLEPLYSGICEASEEVAALQPDLVVVHTPHGISLSQSYNVYSNDNATGNALWNGEWSEFNSVIKLDVTRTKELKDYLSNAGVDIQGMTSYGSLETKMRWGEVIPIWFMKKYLTTDPKYIIISQDSKPKKAKLEEWRLDIGRKIGEFLAMLPEKVVLVISGDLSHFHPTDCRNQLYLPTPGVNMPVNAEGAAAFETAITRWIQSGVSERGQGVWDPVAALPYLEEAVELDINAGACGTKGFVVLHGVMESEVTAGATFNSKIVVHQVPTYYGMLAATFIKS